MTNEEYDLGFANGMMYGLIEAIKLADNKQDLLDFASKAQYILLKAGFTFEKEILEEYLAVIL